MCIYHKHRNHSCSLCTGVQGILEAYTNCIQRVELWGPTNAAPIIYHVARFAAAAQQEEATKGAHVRRNVFSLSGD